MILNAVLCHSLLYVQTQKQKEFQCTRSVIQTQKKTECTIIQYTWKRRQPIDIINGSLFLRIFLCHRCFFTRDYEIQNKKQKRLVHASPYSITYNHQKIHMYTPSFSCTHIYNRRLRSSLVISSHFTCMFHLPSLSLSLCTCIQLSTSFVLLNIKILKQQKSTSNLTPKTTYVNITHILFVGQ